MVVMVMVVVVVVIVVVVVAYHNLCSKHAEAGKIFYLLKTCIHVQYFPYRI
jgi:hypothetical protein